MAKNYMRGREGVLASLYCEGDLIRLNLDDAEGSKAKFPSHWKTITPYTSVEFDKEKILNLELSADEFARIGESLVARLVASMKAYD